MEANYHDPDAFRYALNSFIRAVKEVPIILRHDLQRHGAARKAIDTQLDKLMRNALFQVLQKKRDFIVHHGVLALQSKGAVYTMEGATVKLTFPFPVAPWEPSDDAYERYKEVCRHDKFWRGIGPDCDSSPAIVRTWMIPQFAGRDLLEVAFEAWTLTGQVLSATVVALGGEPLDLALLCRHEPALVRMKRYSQKEFFMSVGGIDLDEEDRNFQAARAHRQVEKKTGQPPAS